jgi:hypothetical protein
MKVQLTPRFLVGIVINTVVSLALIKVLVFSLPAQLSSASLVKIATQAPKEAPGSALVPQVVPQAAPEAVPKEQAELP